ncbi:hypothetical protein SAY86_030797 [Trapa natans]|uniref:non-specific serine/threonine protein kinase n=1 Tax=Trapa natans TaxID=22666 RepID=A0AAN7MNS6_TRANT|nr:hypothetical protein SAY86_030797 [Trapa natans]
MSAPSPAAPPPPTNSTAPPPATPSAPPPASPSAPPPATPSAPPPATASPPPPATASPPPPATASPPPSSPPPSTPSPPPSSTPSPPPPSSTTPSPPPSSTPSPPPPSSTASPPPPSVGSPPPPPSSSTRTPPPPPSSSTRTPPPPPPTSTDSSSSSSSVSTGLVVGIAIGGVALLVVLTVLFICCKKKRRRHPEAGLYPPQQPAPPQGGLKVDPHGGNLQHWQQNAPPPPPAHSYLEMPPNLTPPPGHYPGSYAHPPPPQAYTSSSGGSASVSSGNYSGSEKPFLPPSPGMALGFSKSSFTHEEMRMATDGFSEANLLGQGGFGYVHKGVLPNGKEVAVKQLKAGSGQGEREFQAEVEIISRVHHKHLVSLVGYCITGNQRMLVYEFVPNNTLEFHLHGKGRPTMDWPTRLKIALGSAKGLAYLHEDCNPKIIHRDIKAANILLDFKFEAKVADFGLAKLSSDVNTHISTRVMGTFGYLAPEYASSGKLTDKSDVFSFGVMLLELITGRKPVDTTNTYTDDSLVDWARPLMTRALEDDNLDALVDQKLQRYYNQEEMRRMVACAAACVRHSARRRPRMIQVVRTLEGNASLSDLNEGIQPGHSTIYTSHGSSDYDTSQYKEDLKKFRKMAFASQDYGSSEYSEPTSEHGIYPSSSSADNTREIELRKRKDGQSRTG